MSVPAQHEVDQGKTWVVLEDVDVVRLVDQVDDRGMGFAGDSKVGVGSAGAGVVGAADVEAFHAAFKGQVAVYQDGCAVGFEFVNDEIGAHADVVVAEDGKTLRRFELRGNLRCQPGGSDTDASGAWAAADEVAGQQDEVRVEGVDALDDLLEVRGFGVLEEVNVGDLSDAHADEGIREVANRNAVVGDLEFVARVCAGIETDPESSGTGTAEECATGELRWESNGVLQVLGREFGDGHSPL